MNYLPGSWNSQNSTDSSEELDLKLRSFLKALDKAIEVDRNHMSGIEDKADINYRTARDRAKELQEKGFVEIEGLGDRNSKTMLTLTEKGQKFVDKFDSEGSKDLEEEIKEFRKWFLRLPTRDEIRTIYGPVEDQQLADLELNYVEPSEKAVEENDQKLWLLLLSEIRIIVTPLLDFEHLIPQNQNYEELHEMNSSRINRRRQIEQIDKFNREEFYDRFDPEKIFIEEKSQDSVKSDQDAQLTYSIIEVEIPEPYKSYFESKKGQKYVTYMSRPEADPVNWGFWERLKFILKSELPFVEAPMRRVY